MSPQITIRRDPEIKKRFSKLVSAEGKTPGQALRQLIENYTKQRDTRTYIDDLWNRIGSKLGPKGLKRRDISGVIKEERRANGLKRKRRIPFESFFCYF